MEPLCLQTAWWWVISWPPLVSCHFSPFSLLSVPLEFRSRGTCVLFLRCSLHGLHKVPEGCSHLMSKHRGWELNHPSKWALAPHPWPRRIWGQAYETSGFGQGIVLIKIGTLCPHLLSLPPLLPQNPTSVLSLLGAQWPIFASFNHLVGKSRFPCVLSQVGVDFSHSFVPKKN